MLSFRSQRGDTVIEVAIAFAIFALLAVGASMVMNRGVSSAQEALETTLVRQQIDIQAETLRFLNQEYISNPTSAEGLRFKNIIDNTPPTGGASSFGNASCLTTLPSRAFILKPGNPLDTTPVTVPSNDPSPPLANTGYPALDTSLTPARAHGLWIEPVKGQDQATAVSVGTKFYDFHIRACWPSLTSSAPRTLGTIVRLYVP